MIEQSTDPARTWLAGKLEYPYGRGINFQVRVSDVKGLHDIFRRAEVKIIVPLEEKWYRKDREMLGCRQFVAIDPDGYLLRFSQDLGSTPAVSV